MTTYWWNTQAGLPFVCWKNVQTSRAPFFFCAALAWALPMAAGRDRLARCLLTLGVPRALGDGVPVELLGLVSGNDSPPEMLVDH